MGRGKARNTTRTDRGGYGAGVSGGLSWRKRSTPATKPSSLPFRDEHPGPDAETQTSNKEGNNPSLLKGGQEVCYSADHELCHVRPLNVGECQSGCLGSL